MIRNQFWHRCEGSISFRKQGSRFPLILIIIPMGEKLTDSWAALGGREVDRAYRMRTHSMGFHHRGSHSNHWSLICGDDHVAFNTLLNFLTTKPYLRSIGVFTVQGGWPPWLLTVEIIKFWFLVHSCDKWKTNMISFFHWCGFVQDY